MKLNFDNPEHRNPAILQTDSGGEVVRVAVSSKLISHPYTVAYYNQFGQLFADGRFANGKYKTDGYESVNDIIFKPDAVVPFGHNYDQLTFEQLGEEYRLLDRDEVKPRYDEYKEIEKWNGKEWEGDCAGNGISETYRTKLTREELAALTEEKEEPQPQETPFWDCIEDVPLTIKWLRSKDDKQYRSVVIVRQSGIVVAALNSTIKYDWRELPLLEWSDGTQWREPRKENHNA